MKNMKRFIGSVIVFIALVSSAYADRLAIPSGSLPWPTLRDTYLNVMTAELYTYLGATAGELPATPTFDGMIIRGIGNSWVQVYNNTEWTDTLTGLGGFGILDWHPYTILNGNPERLALYSELGSSAPPTIQSADPTIASDTGEYIATTSGDRFYVVHGVGVQTIAGTWTGDETDPVIGTITPSALTHDGTGVSLSATIASVTETNENDREWRLYDVTDAAVKIDWSVFTGLSIATILIPADQHTYRVDVRCTDLAGNVGTTSSSNIVYSSGADYKTDLSLYYAFATNVEDQHTGNFDLTTVSGAVQDANGLTFTTDYAQRGEDYIAESGEISVMCRFRQNAATTTGRMIVQKSSNTGFMLSMYNGNIHFISGTGSATDNAVWGSTTNTSLSGYASFSNDTNYHTVVAVFSSGSAKTITRAYLDGNPITLTASGADFASGSSAQSFLTLGARWVGSAASQWTNGTISHMAIWAGDIGATAAADISGGNYAYTGW